MSYLLAIITLCISLVGISIIVFRKISELAVVPETEKKGTVPFLEKMKKGGDRASTLISEKGRRVKVTFANLQERRRRRSINDEPEEKSFSEDFWKDLKED